MKNSIILIIFLYYTSCHENNPIDINNNLIEKISKEDIELPSQYNMFKFYVKCDDNDVAYINVQQLRVIYKEFEINKTFYKFLSDTLNQKKHLNQNVDLECFKLDKEIIYEYENNSFQDFINLYFDKNGNNLKLKNKLIDNKMNTIFYFCFLNNYLASFRLIKIRP